MLPILKKLNEASVSAPPETLRREPDKESEDYDGLKSCAQELIDAISAGDVESAAIALRSAFQLLDSEPHVEGPHIKED